MRQKLTEEEKKLRRKLYNAEYYSKNPDRGRERTREKAEYYASRGGKEKKAQRLKANPAVVNAEQARRRAAQLRATPPWADARAIKDFYRRATESGMEVDHIVPLRSKKVCGLHVHFNLQLLTADENVRKGNKFDVL